MQPKVAQRGIDQRSRRLGGAPAAAGGEHPDDVAGREVELAIVGQALGAGLVTAGEEPDLPTGPEPSVLL